MLRNREGERNTLRMEIGNQAARLTCCMQWLGDDDMVVGQPPGPEDDLLQADGIMHVPLVRSAGHMKGTEISTRSAISNSRCAKRLASGMCSST